MVNKLVITPYGARNWMLEEDLEIVTETLGSITVPKGTQTDLASVPRFLWAILPPFGLYTIAAVVHDYLYRSDFKCTREQADATFKELMLRNHVPGWKAWVMWKAVRLGASKCFTGDKGEASADAS